MSPIVSSTLKFDLTSDFQTSEQILQDCENFSLQSLFQLGTLGEGEGVFLCEKKRKECASVC